MVRLSAPKSLSNWIALLLGAAALYLGGTQMVRGVLSLAWPTTDAVVVYSSPRRENRRSLVDVRYDYDYQGGHYRGTRYRFQVALTRSATRSSTVEMIHARYPVGQRITISVNPTDPSDAVIEPGTDFEAFVYIAIGLFLLAAALVHLPSKQPSPVAVRQPRRPSRVAAVLFLIGSGLLALGAYYLYTGWTSHTWPTTRGAIQYSVVRTGSQSRGLELLYEYYVDGVRYLGTDYRVGGNRTPFEDVAGEAGRRYPVGRSVTVYYNPSRPSSAVLEPGIWYGNFVAPVIGFFVLLAAWVAKAYAAARRQADLRRRPQS